MRILIGYDGSAGGDRSAALVGSIAWPAGSSVRVVSAIEPAALLLAGPWGRGDLSMSAEVEAKIQAYVEERLAEVVETLATPDRPVEGVVIRGRPASVIVDEAAAFEADLVVVGSRGHGRVATLVLGSVSGEVVDHASCPVLVARRPAIRQVLFATDGSPSASTAGSILETWPIFERRPIRVVSVADVVQPWHTGIAPTMYQQVLDAYTKDLEEAESAHGRIAEDAAARLRAAGRDATVDVRTGDTAAEIIAAATESDADLVVVGSRGRTGLTRALLGSVARNVVHGSDASVLIVRAVGDDAVDHGS
jgi:nucleotide-binding universal stress UspA family protein